MLSKSAEYAVRALHALAHRTGEEPVTAARLAGRVGVPANYLSKLLHQLQQEGLVASHRGRGGGFELARAPAEVSLAEVVEPFDRILERRCLLGREKCREDDPCPAHDAWREAADGLRTFLRETSLEELGTPATEGTDGRPTARARSGTHPEHGGREIR